MLILNLWLYFYCNYSKTFNEVLKEFYNYNWVDINSKVYKINISGPISFYKGFYYNNEHYMYNRIMLSRNLVLSTIIKFIISLFLIFQKI